jgi:hypothetical protein
VSCRASWTNLGCITAAQAARLNLGGRGDAPARANSRRVIAQSLSGPQLRALIKPSLNRPCPAGRQGAVQRIPFPQNMIGVENIDNIGEIPRFNQRVGACRDRAPRSAASAVGKAYGRSYVPAEGPP